MTDIDFIWIEEMAEIREADYRKILLRLRGGKGIYPQVIGTFNPIGKTSWIYKRFWMKNLGNVKKLHYTVRHNPWASDKEIEDLENTRNDDLNFYKIYFLGEWGELQGLIYNWDVVPYPDQVNFDEYFYGGDFGYSVDPTACVKIYRKSNEYWLREILYRKELTNDLIAINIKEKGVKADDDTYWDSAESKSIKELQNHGINAIPAIKGPDSVRAGIDFLKSCKIHIIEGSENIIKEHNAYIWKKNIQTGESIGKPIDVNNHTMDATRYGIYTHNRGAIDGYADFTEEEAY